MATSKSTSGLYYAQDFDLEDVNIINSNNTTIRLKHLMTEMSFFEDIYSFVVSGYIILIDAVGLIEKLRLDGNEYLELTYGKTKNQNDEQKNKRKYRIYKVGDRRPVGNYTSDFFTLYFCSEELLLSEQIKISKSYKNGRQIATDKNGDESSKGIINDILMNELKVNSDKIVKIEETYGTYNFIIPRLKPFEAISWLSTYARPKASQLGADMLFFQTNDGFYYRSLQSMYQDEVYGTYKYQLKNTNSPEEKGSVFEGISSVLDLEYVKAFDTLHETTVGTYANRLLSVDPLTRRYKITDFNYEEDYASKAVQMNGNPVIGAGTNKLGVSQTDAYNGTFKVYFSNPNQYDIDYIKQNPGSVAKDIYAETFVPYRTAQIALANYTVLKILIPGDSAITAGKTINFNMLSTAVDENGNRKLDEYFSGKYLVAAVRHIIQSSGAYQTILEITKESLKFSPTAPDATSEAQQRLINEAY